MLRFDDLMATRALLRRRPELRERLAAGLTQLAEATGPEAQGRTLLGDLVREGVLAREDAENTQAAVERWKRGRMAGIFGRLLVDRGVAEQTVQALLRSLGELVDATRLGQAAVACGHLAPALEPRLRFQAKQAFDQEARRHVEAFGARSSAATGEVPSSGVFLLSADARGTPELATSAEVTSVLDAAPALVPRVHVPDWIDTAHPMVGRTIGPYRLLGKVGAGAMATVYLAEREDSTTPFALKLVPPGASQELQARFKREILANGFVHHEHIIDVFDAGETADGHHYLVMEFFESEDLDQVLTAQGTLSVRQTLRLGLQVARALEAAHDAGLIHRDVKPANILVAQDGAAKLTDFGLARIRDLGDFKAKVFESDAGGVTGTPEYVSPEQALADPLGPPSDLYALGLVLYRTLSGRLPFQAKSAGGWIQARLSQRPLPLGDAVPGATWPEGLVALVDRLLQKDPAKRPQSAREVAETLEVVFESLAATRRRINPFRKG